jgi:hypothetical protein
MHVPVHDIADPRWAKSKLGNTVVTYACRLEGKSGWSIVIAPDDQAAVAQYLNSRGENVVEFRVAQEQTMLDGWGIDDFDSNGLSRALAKAGWNQDPLAGTWRAPGEPLTEPSSNPTRSDMFTIEGASPDRGWWDLTFRTSETVVTINVSAFQNPIPDIIIWLEHLCRNETASFEIDDDCHIWTLVAHMKSRDAVRLVVVTEENEGALALDVLVSRRMLIHSWWSAILALVADPSTMQEWVSCDSETLQVMTADGDEAIIPPHYESAVIERYLKEATG